ncbi:IS607 family transposase [Coleofasciculus sp.]|jgi:putative resolvase|uniref:IS607 family transposase n=1 Tax=Coleofasciculus sp. TaxID=3100458 RepID=UPI003A176A64
MGRLLSIGEAAAVKGVSIDTLRRWEKEGKIQSIRTQGGHRRYDIDDLIDFPENRKTVAYARVSSHDQKNDLERQALVLEAYCLHHGYNFEIIKDLGSGLNYKKRGLQKLLQLIMDEQLDRLVITNKDRLLRFGSELIFSLCEYAGIEIIVLNRKEDSSYEEDLAADVLEIITVFSARLYGSRSRRNQKILEKLIEVVDDKGKSQ